MQSVFKNFKKKYRDLELAYVKKNDARNYLHSLTNVHLMELLPYFAFDPNTHLFINKNSMGYILELSPLTGANEETVILLASFLTDNFMKNIDLQFLLWASDDIDNILQNFLRDRKGNGETFEWLAKQRVQYLKKGLYYSLTQQGITLVRDFRLFVILSMPGTEVESLSLHLLNAVQDLEGILNSLNICFHKMHAQDFLDSFYFLLYPGSVANKKKMQWNVLEELSLQLSNAEYLMEVNPYFVSFKTEKAEWISQCFSVKQFPSHMVQWKMTDSIGQLFNNALQIPCPFVISLHLRLLDVEKSFLKAQLHYLEADKTARSPLAKFYPLLNEQRQDWEFARQRLSEGDSLVKAFYQVMLYSPVHKMHYVERKLKDLYRANGWQIEKENYLQLQSWLSLLPMLISEGLYEDLSLFKRFHTMTSFNAMNIAPLQAEWKGTRKPNLLLIGRRGQISPWSPFDNKEGNYNVCIAAASGKGKSVLTQEYVVSLLGSGARVWIIDIGRSYEKTCKLLKGEFIEFSFHSPICINPFSWIKDLDVSLEMLKPLLATMAHPTKKATDEELAWIEKAIKSVWVEYGSKTTITHIAYWLQKQAHTCCHNLSLLLYSYTQEGMYGKYFEGDATIQFENNLVVLELQELKTKKDLQRIILLVLMHHIATSMYLGNRSQYKSCIIDEAWDLLSGSNADAAHFIEAGYRTARRYTGNFVTITQSIQDYFKNDNTLAAFDNSDYLILLGQKAEAIDYMKKLNRLPCDAFSERLYKSLRKTEDYSECIIKSPAGLSVHRLILDPYARILYSSTGIDFEAVSNLQSQGYSLKEAVAKIAKDLE